MSLCTRAIAGTLSALLFCSASLLSIAQSNPGPTEVPVDVLEFGPGSNAANHSAFEHYKARKQRLARDNQGDQLLIERGPSNIGGRTRAVMFDPNDQNHLKVWAGGTTGGLWYNNNITNAESSWHNVSDAWANLSVTWICSDPSNSKIFYVSTGESHGAVHFNGAGLWKSIDGGAHWQQIPETAENEDFEHIAKVVVSRKGTVFILIRNAKENSGVWRSTDGGKNWHIVIENAEGADIEVSPSGDLFASTFTTGDWVGAVYKSSFQDDGAPGTWKDITPDNMDEAGDLELAIAPNNANTIYAIGSNMETDIDWGMVSSNGGSSWSFFDAPKLIDYDNCTQLANVGFTDGSPGYKLAAAVHPQNSNVLYLGGTDVFRSSDAGKNWTLIGSYGNCGPLIHADHHTFIFRPSAPEEMVFANDGGVYYSNSAGDFSGAEATFHSRNKDYNVTQFYAAAMENLAGSNYMLAGSQDNNTQRFTEPGYGPTSKVTPNDGLLCFIDQDDSDHQVTSAQNNIVYYSSDGGANFSTNDQNKTVQFENPMEYDSNGGILYMAGNNGKLMVTALAANDDQYTIRDIGLETGSVRCLHMSPQVQGRVYVGTSQSDKLVLWVYGALNGNNMGVENATGDLALTSVQSIDFGETTSDLLVTGRAKLGQASQCTVWETSDGGNHWVEKQGDLPKGMFVNYGIYNPHNRNQVMLATEAGLWITGNFSEAEPEWDCISPNFYVKRLRYRDSDGRVAIATYGRGLWTTDMFSSGGCKDIYEPNDDWAVNAKPIEPGVHMQGTIHKFLDADYFKFSITGNQFDPGKDVTIHFLNKYNLGSVVALFKIIEGEDQPKMLAGEIANKPVFFSGATPGNYLVMVWGGYSAPETFLNCYDLQLDLKDFGEGISPPPDQNDGGAPLPLASPTWIKQDDWVSSFATVLVNNKTQQAEVALMSLARPIELQLQGVSGRRVYSTTAAAQPPGPATINLPLTKIKRGEYRLLLTDGIQHIDLPLTVQ